MYHHIIYMCDFLVNLDDFFDVIFTSFHEDYGFHQICSPPYKLLINILNCVLVFLRCIFKFSGLPKLVDHWYKGR